MLFPLGGGSNRGLMVSIPTAPTGSPKIVHVRPIGAGSLEIKWQPPTQGEQNGRLTSYKILWEKLAEPNADYGKRTQRKNGNGGEILRSADEPNQMEIDGLDTFTLYKVTVTAGTGQGFGPESQPVQRRTIEDGEPVWYLFLFKKTVSRCLFFVHVFPTVMLLPEFQQCSLLTQAPYSADLI